MHRTFFGYLKAGRCKQKRHLFRFFEKVSKRKGHREVHTCAFYLQVRAKLKQKFRLGQYEIVVVEIGNFTIGVIISLNSFPCFNLFSVP